MGLSHSRSSFVDNRTLTEAQALSYTVRVADAALNLTTIGTAYTATIDTTAPTTTAAVTGLADNMGAMQGNVATGTTTDDTSLTVTGTLGGATDGASLTTGETVRVYDTGTYLGDATVTVAAGGQSTWSFVDTRTLANAQAVSYTVQVADAALNLTTVGTAYTATVDTTAPTTTAAVTGLLDNVGTITGSVATGATTDDTSLTVIGTLGGATAGASLAAGESLRVYDGSTYLGDATVTVAAGAQSTWSFVDTRTLTNAQALSYTVRVADAALNLTTAGTAHTATVDTTAPTMSSTSPGDDTTAVATSANVVLTFAENIQLASSGTITLKSLNGGTDIVIDLANTMGQLSVSGGTLTINPIGNMASLGQYAMQMTAGSVTDLAGNAYAGMSDTTTLNFTATSSSAVVTGTGGNDLMTATSGTSGTPYTDANGNQIDGSDGINDTIDGGLGNDTIDGALGNDSIDGGLGNDSITGGAGADTLNGGAGADTLIGGIGNDSIDLGATDGAVDVVVLANGSGSDTLTNFEAPTLSNGVYTAHDLLDVSGMTVSGNPLNVNHVVVSNDSGNTKLTFTNGETITLVGVTPPATGDTLAFLRALGLPDVPSDGIVSGTVAGELINASYTGDPDTDKPTDNADTIYGYGGNDTVVAGAGNDLVFGDDPLQTGASGTASTLSASTGWVVSNYSVPTVTSLAQGGYVAAGMEYQTAGSNQNYRTVLQRYDDTGTAVGSPIIMAEGAWPGGLQTWCNPRVAQLGNGFVVVNFNYATQGIDIVRFDQNGTQLGTTSLPASVVRVGAQYTPSVILSQQIDVAELKDADGGFVVGWHVNEGTGVATWTQRYSVTGVAEGSPIQMLTGAGSSDYVSLSSLADGGYVMGARGYASNDTSGNYTAIYRTVDATGTRVDASPLAISSTGTGAGSYVSVDYAENGTWGVAVFQGDSGTLQMRIFDATGHPTGANIAVYSGGGSLQTADVAALADGRVAVVFNISGTPTYQQYLQVLDQSGNMLGNRVLLGNTNYADVSIGALTDGGFVLNYVNEASNQMISQRYTSAGVLVDYGVDIADVGNDSINGGAGNDTLDGGMGNDTLLGDAGDDTLVLKSHFGGDSLVGGETGETLGDTLNASSQTTGVTITFTGDEAGTASISTVDIATFSQIERFVLGSGNDLVSGAAANTAMYVESGTGRDTIVAGAGNDTLLSAAGKDLITAGAGNDSVEAGADYDQVDGGAGNDTIDAGTGDDILVGGLGSDTLIGGDGGDLLQGGQKPAALLPTGVTKYTVYYVPGSAFTNPLIYADPTNGGTTNIFTGAAGTSYNISIIDDDSNLQDEDVGVRDATYQRYADVPTGVAGLNVLDGTYATADLVRSITNVTTGQSGLAYTAGESDTGIFSTIKINPGDTVTYGTPSLNNNIVPYLNLAPQATATDLTLDADTSNDSLSGGAGNDTIFGGKGADTLDGGTGNDTLNGGDGNDTLTGGEGNDMMGAVTVPLANLLFNASFEDGSHYKDGIGLTGWTSQAGTPDASDDGTSSEVNAALYASEGTGYIAMHGSTTSPYDAIKQTLLKPLVAGQTYTLTFKALSTTGANFTPSDANGVRFELLNETATLMGFTTVQSLDYQTYSITFTPTATTTAIILRPYGSGTVDYPGVILDEVFIASNTDLTEAGDDTFMLSGAYGNDTIAGGETSETLGDTLNASGVTANTTLTFSAAEAGTLSVGTNTADFTQVERFVLGSGNDTVNLALDTGAMNVNAGDGNDAFALTAANITKLASTYNSADGVVPNLNGGAGLDTLRVSGGATLNLTTIATVSATDAGGAYGSRLSSIEKIDLLTDTAANTVKLDTTDVQAMASTNVINSGNKASMGVTGGTYVFSATETRHTMIVDGSTNDTVVLTGGFTNTGTTVVMNGHTYKVYNQGSDAQVWVESTLPVSSALLEFTSAATATVAENTAASTVVYDANATQDGGAADAGITYSLQGTDASLFSINSTGQVKFIASPDYEAPANESLDNSYKIQVVAANAAGDRATKDVTISVTNVAEPVTPDTGTTFTQTGLNKVGLVSYEVDGLNYAIASTTTGYRVLSVADNGSGSFNVAAVADYNNGTTYNGVSLTVGNNSYDRDFKLVRIGCDVKFVDVSMTSVNVFTVNQSTGAMTLTASIATPSSQTNTPRNVGVWESTDGGYTVAWGNYSAAGINAVAFNADNTVKTAVYQISTTLSWSGTNATVDTGNGTEVRIKLDMANTAAEDVHRTRINADGTTTSLGVQRLSAGNGFDQTMFSARVPQTSGVDKTYVYTADAGQVYAYELDANGTLTYKAAYAVTGVVVGTSSADVYTDPNTGNQYVTVSGHTLQINVDGTLTSLSNIATAVNQNYQEGDQMVINGQLVLVNNETGALKIYKLGVNTGDQGLLNEGLNQQGTSGNNNLVGDDDCSTKLWGLAGNDTLTGGTGADSLYGGAGTDSLVGGAGADSLVGGTGADTLNGGAGNDAIDLGAADGANDVVVLSNGMGADTLIGFEAPVSNGSGGLTAKDVFNVSGLLGNGNPVMAADVVVTNDGNGNAKLTFPGGESVVLVGISPATASDVYFLNAIGFPGGPGTVEGTVGNDVIDVNYTGDPQGDLITSGSDTVRGLTGNDTINAGGGADSIEGGSGDDTVLLTGTFGNDIIAGGETGQTLGDTLNASGVTVNTTLTFSAAEAGTLSDGTNTANFTQVERFVLGSGNDTVNLALDTGAMNVNAGDGNDAFVLAAANITKLASTYNSADGVVPNLNGGAGLDTLRVSGGANLNLTTIANFSATDAGGTYGSRLSSIEKIDLLTDAAANVVKLDTTDVQAMASTNVINSGNKTSMGVTGGTYVFGATETRHTMIVDGNTSDTLVLTGGFTDTGTTVVMNGATYKVYNQGSDAQVWVDSTVTLTTVPVVFTSGATASVAENTAASTVVYDANANEVGSAADAGITYSLQGIDSSLFSINASTGQVKFITPPDYEIPRNEGLDNAYQIQVVATNAAGDKDTQAVTVSVTDVVEATTASTWTTSTQTGLNGSGLVTYEANDSNFVIAGTTTGYRVLQVADNGSGGVAVSLVANYNFGTTYNAISLTGAQGSSGAREFQLVRIGCEVKFVDVASGSVNVFAVNADTGMLTLEASVVATGSTASYPRAVSVWENTDGGYTVNWANYSAAGEYAIVFNANNTVKTPQASVGTAGAFTGTGATVDTGNGTEARFELNKPWNSTVLNVIQINADGTSVDLLGTQSLTGGGSNSQTLFSARVPQTTGPDKTYVYAPDAGFAYAYELSSTGTLTYVGTYTVTGVIAATSSADVYVNPADGTVLATISGNTLRVNANGSLTSLSNLSPAINTVKATESDQMVINGQLVLADNTTDTLTIYKTGVGTGDQGLLNEGLNQQGTSGNDNLVGDADCSSKLWGLGGNDTLTGGTGADSLYGGSGTDSLVGGAGNDSLVGGTGADTLNGGTGNDAIDLGASDAANDVVVLSNGMGADTVVGFEAPVSNGSGGWTAKDVFNVSGLLSNGSVVLAGEVVVTNDGNGNAKLTFPGGDSVILVGISPNTANDVGFLRAIGFADGTGIVEGTSGNDVIDVNYVGDPQGDLITSGSDTVRGMAGNDTIQAGGGADNISGGSGDDTVLLTGTFGNDVIVGEETGETLGDTIDASGLAVATTLTYTGSEAGTLADGTSTATFSQVEKVKLGTGNDTLNAAAASTAVNVDGGAGNDSLTGGAGADSLVGGAGADLVSGGAGNDTIDLRVGGVGDGSNDAVALTNGMGNDVIYGFEAPTGTGSNLTPRDVFNRSGLTGVSVAQITVGNDGSGNATLTFPNGESVTLMGIAPAAVTSDFLKAVGFTMELSDNIVTGTASAELIDTAYTLDLGGDMVTNSGSTLRGLAGDDTLNGANGNDTIGVVIPANEVLTNGSFENSTYSTSGTTGTVGNWTVGAEAGQVNFSKDGVSEWRTAISAAEGSAYALIGSNGTSLKDISQTVSLTAGQTYTLSFNAMALDSTGPWFTPSATPPSALVQVLDQAGNVLGSVTVSQPSNTNTYANYTFNITPSVNVTTLRIGVKGQSQYNSIALDSVSLLSPVADIYELGNDVINGGLGNDLVYSGVGNDTVQLTGVFGNDTIHGGNDANGLDVDVLDATALTAALTVVYTAAKVGTLSDGTSTANFYEMEAVKLGSGSDTVNAGGLIAAGINVDGGAGNDSLLGGAGNDTLIGGAGADTIKGGAGNDSFDLRVSGAGDGVNDTLVLNTGSGDDTVEGFEGPTGSAGSLVGHDLLNVAALTTSTGALTHTNNVTVAASGSNTVLTFVNGEKLTLNGISAASVTSEFLAAMGIPLYSAPQTLNTTASSTVISGHTAPTLTNGSGGAAITNSDVVTLSNGNFVVLSGDCAAGNNGAMPLKVYLTVHNASGTVLGQVAVVNSPDAGQTAIRDVSLTDLHDGRIAIQYLLNTVIVGGNGEQTIRSYGHIYDISNLASLTQVGTFNNGTWNYVNNIAGLPMADSVDLDADSFLSYSVTQNTTNLVATVLSNTGTVLRSYTVDTAVLSRSAIRNDAQLEANGHVVFLYQQTDGDVVMTDLNTATGALSTPKVVTTLLSGTSPATVSQLRMTTLANGDYLVEVNTSLYRLDSSFNVLTQITQPESTEIASDVTKVVALADGGFAMVYGAHYVVNVGYGIYVQVYDKFNNKNGGEITLAAAGSAYTSNDVGLSALNGGGFVVTWAGGTGGREVSMKIFNATGAPVVLDLNRDGVLDYSTVAMDVNGDRVLDQTAWVGAKDGVLVWDKQGDGLVHDQSQYAFIQYGGSTDLEGLAIGFDSNHDGVFNAQDEKFGAFMVWQDADQDGVSDAGETRSLADEGLTSIDLTSDGVARTPAAGVTEAGQTTATTSDGSSMLVADASFDYSSLAYSVQAGSDGAQLTWLGADMVLNFSSFVALHGDVASVDLNGSGANTLKLDLAEVLSGLGEMGQPVLKVQGGSDDRVALSHATDWTATGTSSEAGVLYNVWQHTGSAHQVLIDQHLQVI